MSFLLFIGFLVIGYSISTKFYQPTYGAELSPSISIVSTKTNSIESLNNYQQNFLLIGVNKIATQDVRLESLWLVSNITTDSTLYLLPIFPTGNESISDIQEQLYRSFKLEKKNGELTLGQDFLKILEVNNYWWSGFLVADSAALMDFINNLGDTEQKRESIFRDHNFKDFHNAINDPKKAFAIQLAIFQTACQKLSELSSDFNLEHFFTLSPTHLITDLDFNQVLKEWNALRSNGQGPSCRFPTLEISMIDN